MIAPPIVWFHSGRKHAAIYRQYVPPLGGGFARRLFYWVGYALGLAAGPGAQDPQKTVLDAIKTHGLEQLVKESFEK